MDLDRISGMYSFTSVKALCTAFLNGEIPSNVKAMTTGYYENSTIGGCTYLLRDAIIPIARPSPSGGKFIHVGDGGLFLEALFGSSGGYASQFGATNTNDLGKILSIAQENQKLINLDEMHFAIKTPFLVKEGVRLIGAGAQIPKGHYESGSMLLNNTSEITIAAEGTWSGFNSRRFIELSEFSILSNGIPTPDGIVQEVAPATIYCDFLTIFDMRKIIIYGNSVYHLHLINSYNGTLRDSRFYGARVANMYITTDPTASVFSGQMLIENVDFWTARNENDDAAGTLIDKTANLMEQIQFNKCHWQDSDIGLWIKAGGEKTLIAAHFEANHQYDLLVESNADNPKILSGFCNNALTTLSSFKIGGRDGCIKQFDFINVDNDAWCIDITKTCDGLVVDGVTITQKSGASTKGIKVAGKNITIKNIKCFSGGSPSSWNVITFTSTAKNIYVKNVVTENFGPAIPMIDEGATNIVFEGAQTFVSAEFDLDGDPADDTVFTDISGYVNRAWLVYNSSTGNGSAAISVGRSTSPGHRDYPRYVSQQTTPNALQHTREKLKINKSAYFAASDALVFRCAGKSKAYGRIKIIVEITPFRALT